MKKTILAMMSIALLTGCSKNSKNDLVEDTVTAQNAVMGAYSGAFTRTGIADTGYLMIDINHERYDGRSQNPNFPGICGGYYTVDNKSIVFNDTCNISAAVKLEGTYQYEKKGDSLKFWRTTNGITDLYRMARLFR